MITLKKHYAISTAVQVTGILIILSANAKGKDGKYIFTPEGKNNLLNIISPYSCKVIFEEEIAMFLRDVKTC